MADTEPYDPIPHIAAVLAGLQVPRSMFDGRALGAALAPYDHLRDGLGLFGYPPALEQEKLLYSQLAALSDCPDGWRQRFVTEDGINKCATCLAPMQDGEIRHARDCPGLLRGLGR